MAEPPGAQQPAPPARIEGIFRSGSLTAISVVVGFSLGFLVRWSGLPGRWARSDVFAVAAISVGAALQIKALVDLLSVDSLIVARYARAIRIFVVGLVFVAAGVVAAIFAGIIGRGGLALSG
jgi:hypothetical protein